MPNSDKDWFADDPFSKMSDASLAGDTPLTRISQDRLGRSTFVEQLAETILNIDPREGFVFAINGSWGAGKTSVINMTLQLLDKSPQGRRQLIVFRFNPWWFSGQDQLLTQFLRQFSAVLGQRDLSATLGRVSKSLDLFGRALVPVSYLPIPIVGDVARGLRRGLKDAGDAAQSAAQDVAQDLNKLRHRIDEELSQQDRHILVLMDDIDRLSGAEIRQVFQLVKAIADFPNTIYLLAFDNDVVAKAVEKVQGGDGGQYLEKIVQLPLDLPSPDETGLQLILGEGLESLIGDPDQACFDQEDWSWLYFSGLDTFIGTPRQAGRLLNSLRATYPAVADHVNAVDFIGIQALRIFAPKAYAAIETNHDLLTRVSHGYKRASEGEQQAFWDILLVDGEKHNKPLREIVERLFPELSPTVNPVDEVVARWRRERRVCVSELFDAYFRLSLAVGQVAPLERQRVISSAEDPEVFGKELVRLAKTTRPDGMTQLRAFLDQVVPAGDFTERQVGPALNGLLEYGDELQELTADDQLGRLDFEGGFRLIRFLFQLVKIESDQERRFQLLREAFKGAPSLSVIVPYLTILAQEHGRYGEYNPPPDSERTVATARLNELIELVLSEIRHAASEGSLRKTPRFDVVLRRWSDWGDEAEPMVFVHGLVSSDCGMVDYVMGFARFYKVAVVGRRDPELQVLLNVEDLVRFSELSIDSLRERSNQILRESTPDELSDRQRMVLSVIGHLQ